MKVLRFRTFDFQAFKDAYAKRCEEQRDMRPVGENEIARATAADFVTMGMMTREELDEMPVLEESDAPVTRRTLRMTENETRLAAKATYLMDELIYRAVLYAKDDPELSMMAGLNASVMKEMIGRDYKPILEAFKDLNYIKVGKTHDIGSAKMYEVIDGIVETDCPKEIERKVEDYRQRTEERLTREEDKEQVKTLTRLMQIDDPKANDTTSTKFRTHYIKGLNKIRIVDEQGLNKAIPELKAKAEKELNKNGKPKDPESIRIYYDAIARTLREEKRIYRIDSQGRIYHALTGMKTELKQYLSIAYSLDAANSHPLLFNYILCLSHGVGVSSSYKMSCLLHQLYDFSIKDKERSNKKNHYVGKYIRKYLIDNGIKEEEIAGFADDELRYIYETTNGRLWDNIWERHKEYDRVGIKEKMFKEVFYSNTPRMVYRHDGVREEKVFGKMFKRRYPNVYKEIARWKHPEKHPDIQRYLDQNGVKAQKTTASLPIALMSLESRIFTSVLSSLFRKRYYAVHIHDCIVIPETGNKHQPTREEVERLLMKEYAKYGLVPTLKAE